MIVQDIWIFTAIVSFVEWKLYFWYDPAPENKLPIPIISQHLLAKDCFTSTGSSDDESEDLKDSDKQSPPQFDEMLTTMIAGLGDMMAAKQSGTGDPMENPFQQMIGMFALPGNQFGPIQPGSSSNIQKPKRLRAKKLPRDEPVSVFSVIPDDEIPIDEGSDSGNESEDNDIMAAMKSARKVKTTEEDPPSNSMETEASHHDDDFPNGKKSMTDDHR